MPLICLITAWMSLANEQKTSDTFQLQYQRRLSPALGIAVTELTCPMKSSCVLTEVVGDEKRQAKFDLSIEGKKEILKLLKELDHHKQGQQDTFQFSWKVGQKIMAHTVDMQNQKPVSIAAQLVSILEAHFQK